MLPVDVIKKKVYRKSIQSVDKLTFEEENIVNDDVSRNIETSSHDDSEYQSLSIGKLHKVWKPINHQSTREISLA